MTIREWLYQLLTEDAGIVALVADRTFQGGSLTTAQINTPFLVYRFGNDTDEALGGGDIDDPQPHRSFIEVYAHDSRGDYTTIDEVLDAVKAAFRVDDTHTDVGVMQVRYLETSRDQADQTLNTIFRYSRYQLIRT